MTWLESDKLFWNTLIQTHSKCRPQRRRRYAQTVREAAQTLKTPPSRVKYLTYLNPLHKGGQTLTDKAAVKIMAIAKTKGLPLIAMVTNYHQSRPVTDKEGQYMQIMHYDFGEDVSHSEQQFITGLVRVVAKELNLIALGGLEPLEFVFEERPRN